MRSIFLLSMVVLVFALVGCGGGGGSVATPDPARYAGHWVGTAENYVGPREIDITINADGTFTGTFGVPPNQLPATGTIGGNSGNYMVMWVAATRLYGGITLEGEHISSFMAIDNGQDVVSGYTLNMDKQQ